MILGVTGVLGWLWAQGIRGMISAAGIKERDKSLEGQHPGFSLSKMV